MKTGIVKFYNSEKGFGFIKDNETQEEIFVHRTGVRGVIRENDSVSYDVERGQKGMNAVNVQLNS